MKTIKTVLLLLLSLCVAYGAKAQLQTKSVVHTDSTTVVTIVKTFAKFSPKHDLRVGVGTVSVSSVFLLDDGSAVDYAVHDFRYEMENADSYLTPRNFIGNYTLSYTYHDRRWLQYGGTVAFGASTRWRKDVKTGKKIENLSYFSLSVMPTVRFVWFYRDAVQLYSSISACLVTDFDGIYAWGDMALVGCSFGRKLFGFVEVGGGISGIARAGIGYRFNANKK